MSAPASLSYIHVYDHNIQTSSLNPLGQSKQKLNVEHRYERGMKVNINGQGHMATMAMNSKNIIILFIGTERPMILKVNGALQSLYNHDPRLTLTFLWQG